MEIGDELVTGVVGNTNMVSTTPPDTRKQYVYWCFTLNNHTDGDVESLKTKFNYVCKWWRFQEEIGSKGTPHLQGVCCFKNKLRLTQLKDNLSNKAHWEASRSSAANAYCSKSDTATGRFWESNNIPKTKTPEKKPIFTQKVNKDMLRPHQIEIADKYLKECEMWSRIIDWYWEQKGGWGKSTLCKYLIDNCNAIVLSGSVADAVNGFFSYVMKNETVPPIVVFDIPRCNQGHISYNAIEQIKNGCIFNTKFETGMLRFDTPHVIVFSNEEPEYEKLSTDRWNVVELKHPDTTIRGSAVPATSPLSFFVKKEGSIHDLSPPEKSI